MKTFTGYTNIFDDGEGRRYPSGTIFETAEAALTAQKNPALVGKAVFLAQVTWSEEKADSDWKIRR
ncbi:hypothetical protein V1291_004827 [Nitrobacteraceae bacterium AZCC 1564]